jgi:hypothetical protein
MCMIDDSDPCRVYSTRFVVARKTHVCTECGRNIAIGERYKYAFGVDDFPFSAHTCHHCTVAQDWLVQNCGGFLHSGVSEDIAEHVIEYPDLAFGLTRLRRGMERRWRSFKGTGLLPLPRMPDSISSVVTA